MQRFWGSWCCEASMRESFEIKKDWGYTILFAAYDTGSYEGIAYVLGIRQGKAFEVFACHCSCFGLEDQWKEEPTAIDNLSVPSWLGEEELTALRQIVDHAVTKWGIR